MDALIESESQKVFPSSLEEECKRSVNLPLGAVTTATVSVLVSPTLFLEAKSSQVRLE